MGRSEVTPPLDPTSLRRIETALTRLQTALRRLLGTVPAGARRATGLARHLDLDRTTCHRVVTAAGPGPMNAIVGELPGLRAILALAAAARRRGADETLITELEQAASAFDAVVREVAGSQTRLARAVAALGPAAAGETPALEDADARELARSRFHDAAALVAGRWSEVASRAHLIWPHDERHVRGFSGAAVRGHHREVDAIPCVVPFEPRETGATSPAARPTATLLVPSLTSSDAIELVLHSDGGETALQVIEPPDPGPAGVDLAVTEHAPRLEPAPHRVRPPMARCWAIQHLPARVLVLDAFLHVDLARRSVPSGEVHGFGSEGTRHAGSRVHTRFPHGPRVEVLGRGLAGAACVAFDGEPPLLQALFERAGVDPDDFIGHRCLVRWPLWRCAYCIAFDFGGNGPAGKS